MKIAENTISAVEKYLSDNLETIYTEREIAVFTDVLFEDLLAISKTERFLNAQKRLSESELLKIVYACKDLKKQIPVQYITGKAFFKNLWLEVNHHVLIPRPETEELVSLIIRENKTAKKIIDFCTGSGCVALVLKKEFQSAETFATDVSKEALTLAERNAKNNNIDVRFFCEDVLSERTNSGFQQADIIVANPPYVLESDKSEMSSNVLNHEPHLALFVPDEDALKFYKAIAKKAAQLLKKDGKLYFEIHEEKGKAVSDLLSGHGFSNIRVLKDFYGKDRFVSGTWLF